MITRVVSPLDAINILNENLNGLLTGKRKIQVVKEVNNTVGKMMEVHKLEAISKNLSGDKTALSWFDTKTLSAPTKRRKR